MIREVWLREKSDPKGGKVMTVRFTGIARRQFPKQGQGSGSPLSPEAFPKGFHVRKTIAFAFVLALLLPIARRSGAGLS